MDKVEIIPPLQYVHKASHIGIRVFLIYVVCNLANKAFYGVPLSGHGNGLVVVHDGVKYGRIFRFGTAVIYDVGEFGYITTKHADPIRA
jgi:hypothetical protein